MGGVKSVSHAEGVVDSLLQKYHDVFQGGLGILKGCTSQVAC